MVIVPPPRDGPVAQDTTDVGAERRHLTILFVDMVSSTEHAVSLDPEDFRPLMENFLQTCTAVIRSHKGVVASYIGDAIKGHFGFPTAHEDDADLALLAAIEIIETVASVPPMYDKPLQVRLGIASGQTVVGNIAGAPDGVSAVTFGPVAHLAARLQTLAEPNTILTDDATFRAASGAFEFTDFGVHFLKGFAEPIHVWRAHHARSLPSRFARRGQRSRMYGREAEIELLLERWNQVGVRRGGQVAVITGEPGIGKSRLISEVQQRLHNFSQLFLQCSSTFENSTLYPFLTLLKARAGISKGDGDEEVVRKLRDAFAPDMRPAETAIAILASLLGVHTPEVDRLSTVSAERQHAITKQLFINWVRQLGEAEPVIVILEDQQWSDTTSWELLCEIVMGLASIPAFVLISARDRLELPMSVDANVLQIDLQPLNSEDANKIIRDVSTRALPTREVVTFVLNRAEGNPLYIEELARSALENGLPLEPPSVSRPNALDEIPSSLQSSLLARLDKLGRAKEIAQVAATIGREFEFELLQEVCESSPESLRAQLGVLASSGLIEEQEEARGSKFAFRHVLLHQAARGTMLREGRRYLHARIAAKLEARNAAASSVYPELLAQHHADAGNFDRAAEYWLMAAVKAGRTWAKADAVQMLGKGLDAARMLPQSIGRSRLILRLELERGDLLYAAFGYMTGEGTASYRRAMALSDELGDMDAPIRALDGLFGTSFNSGRFADSIEMGNRLIKIGESRNSIKALVLGLQFKGMSVFCQGRLKTAKSYLTRALRHKEKAEEIGSDFPSMPLIYLSWAQHILGHRLEAVRTFTEAETIVRQQSAYRLAACLGNGCILFAFRDDHAKVVRLAEELLPLAIENGFNLWANVARFFKGWAMVHVDRTLAGADVMQEFVVGLGDQEVDKSCYLGLLARAFLQNRQFNRAARIVEEGLQQAYKIGEHYYTAALLTTRGEVELALQLGEERAMASFREAIAFARKQHAKSWEFEATVKLARCLKVRGKLHEGEVEAQPVTRWFLRRDREYAVSYTGRL